MCPFYSSGSLLSSIDGWSCSRNSDHDVNLRMKANARSGNKKEKEAWTSMTLWALDCLSLDLLA